MIKKTGENLKIDKDYFICKGCDIRVHSLIPTTIGLRCLKCVINNNLTFLSDGETFRRWASNARWFKEKEEIIELK